MAEPTSRTGTIALPATTRAGYKDLSRGWLALALALFALIWLSSLGARSLVHTDEGRYAALALEMARHGDFITPRLNGLLYFEKPPLQYWIGALSIRLFGATEFAARLWPGLAGLLTVLAVGLTAGRLWGRTSGMQAFAIAGSTTWIVGLSHVLTLDAGLTLFLTLTLCAILLAECADLPLAWRHRCAWVAWLSMACAVLSKGLVGIVIPCGSLLVASLWMRDFGPLHRLRPALGLLMLMAVAGPWFILVSLRNPGFAEFFFIHEHFARYLTQVHHRLGPWWYYLPLLLVGMLPWTSGLPWLLRRGKTMVQPARPAPRGCWPPGVDSRWSSSACRAPSCPPTSCRCFRRLPCWSLCNCARQARRVLRWHLLIPVLLWVLLVAGIHRAVPFRVHRDAPGRAGAARFGFARGRARFSGRRRGGFLVPWPTHESRPRS